MTEYIKLVRDKIPEIIEADGQTTAITHIATEEEYGESLIDKLTEEVNEFKESQNIEELADVLEVIDAIVQFKHIRKSDLQSTIKTKRQQKGSFSRRIILDRIESNNS